MTTKNTITKKKDKDITINIRLNQYQYNQIKELAQANNTGISTYIRNQALTSHPCIYTRDFRNALYDITGAAESIRLAYSDVINPNILNQLDRGMNQLWQSLK